ncbi:cupin domain-containing protein [Jeotgalibacillus sp. ET6]|uniref:cupin domain-containing protein n=1 Tax=Jeotgalibacillus sp. ET6 TaxID=3037260 RepID=UPI002418B714|nr:cupin domain-containing protein [Jeotgalibacillus sp. ET6]MDG5473487.1 cupin domain-containing protein [Jeotgalibacillus sp. ET6]
MEIFTFKKENGKRIEAFDSNFVMSRITKTSSHSMIGCMYLEENGVIGYHQAVTPQMLLIVKGEGEVRSNNGKYFPVKTGDAVFWGKDEWHETRSEEGLMAIVIESEELTPGDFIK